MMVLKCISTRLFEAVPNLKIFLNPATISKDDEEDRFHRR